MRASAVIFTSACVTAFASAGEPAKKITYEDDVLPIFRDNCLKCHNPDKLKGDLDLTSFSSAIKGGGSGATLNAGDPESSQLFKSIAHSDEPTMPPNAKLSDRDIATIRKWIEGGLLQGASSKAIASNKPVADLALKAVAIGKPDGPPPMPSNLSLDPAVRAVHGSALSAIASSPWAPIVALAGARQIVIYNTDSLEFTGVLPFAEGLPCDVKFSRNGKLLLASGGRGGQSGVVVVWDITTGERVITVGDQFDSVLAADVSADQQWIALGGPDRVLKIYRTKDGALEHRIKKHTEWVTAVEFSPDSRYLASGDRNGGVVLWETETGRELFTLNGHKGGITALTWRGDSEMVASASEDGTIKLWKASDGTALRNITAHSGGTLCARFNHEGQIVSCGRDNKVQVWETSGKNVRALPFSGDLPNRVTFTHDGKRVVAGDWKGAVTVWDTKSGKVVGELDATPPSLRERVDRGSAEVAKLEAEANAAVTAHLTAESAAKKARAKIDAANKAVADARARTDFAATQLTTLEQAQAEAAANFGAAVRHAGEAQIAANKAAAKLAAAKASLAKWQAALHAKPITVKPASAALQSSD